MSSADLMSELSNCSTDDILRDNNAGLFIPKIQCVMDLFQRLTEIKNSVHTGNIDSMLITLKCNEQYLLDYANHCKRMITIYAFSDLEFNDENPTYCIPSVFPKDKVLSISDIINCKELKEIYGLTENIRLHKKKETLRSIVANLGSGFLATFAHQQYRQIRHLLTQDSDAPLEFAENARENYFFYKRILSSYQLDFSDTLPGMNYDSSDYFGLAFRSFQSFLRLGRKKEAAEMELEIESILTSNPDSYWGLFYARFKFFDTGKTEFLFKLRDIAFSMKQKVEKGDFLFEIELIEAHIHLCDAIIGFNLSKINEGIQLVETATNNPKYLSDKLHGDLSYEGLLSVLKMYRVLIILVNSKDTRVDNLSESINEILELQMNWTFRQEFDFHGKSALKFLVFSTLSNLDRFNAEVIGDMIKTIDEIIIDNFANQFYDEQEIIFFRIAKNIMENLGNSNYVPQTDFILSLTTSPKSELSLDTRIFGLMLVNEKWSRMKNFSDKENLYRLVYETLVEIGHKKLTYTKLPEESIRDILCTMLNSKMTMHIAHTEVRTGKGRTDIYIDSKNPEKPFFRIIIECLVWGGAKVYAEKKKQLFGYLDVTDMDGGLITFSKNIGFGSILDEARIRIEKEDDFISGSFIKTSYIPDLHNFSYQSKHTNHGGKPVELKHFFLDLSAQ